MKYGDLEVSALPEGHFTVGVDKRFVPFTDGDTARPGTLFISVTPFLVQTPSETILLDTGLGSWAEGRGTEVMIEGLAAHGVAPEQVDRVLLSHLHMDHIGGTVSPVGTSFHPTFPNADYVVQAREVDGDGYDGESARARDIVVETLDRAGQLVLLDGDMDEGPVSFQRTGGHTEAHQIIRLQSGALEVLFGGDIMGTPSQVTRRFVAKYDVDGEESQRWRSELAAEAAEGGHLVLFYHSTNAPAAFISDGARGQRIVEPVSLNS